MQWSKKGNKAINYFGDLQIIWRIINILIFHRKIIYSLRLTHPVGKRLTAFLRLHFKKEEEEEDDYDILIADSILTLTFYPVNPHCFGTGNLYPLH